MDQNQNQFESVYQTQTSVVKNASYFRARAREALKGKWWDGILLAFLYTLLCGGAMGGVSSGFSSNSSVEINLGGVQIPTPALGAVIAIVAVLGVAALAYNFFVASPIVVGYMKTNLDFVDGKKPEISTMFSYFKINYLKTVGLYALYMLMMAVPTLICIGLAIGLILVCASVHMIGISSLIVGLVAIFFGLIIFAAGSAVMIYVTYAYRYCFTILAEYPQLKAIEALRMSRNLMKGNKWKAFCLDISFIGWYLLAVCCTCGIGMIAVLPYHQVASAAFYDEISQRSRAKETEFPSLDPDDYSPDDDDSPNGNADAPVAKKEVFMGEGMPFTSEIMFPSLDLNDYTADENSDKKEND